jgi:hypothetical protein
MTGTSVGRANIDGSSPNSELIDGILACGVAADSGHVYWLAQTVQNSYIGRAELGGLNPDYDFAKLKSGFQCGVAIDALHVYWADLGLGAGKDIGRADISNGSGVDETFISGGSGVCGLTVFDSQLYWVNAGTDSIARASIGTGAASAVDQDFIATKGPFSCGVAVDSLAPPAAQPPGSGVQPDTTAPQTRIVYGPAERELTEGTARLYYISSEAATYRCKLDGRKVTGCGRWNGGPLCKPRPPKCNPNRKYANLAPGRHKFRVWATDLAGNKDATPAKRSFRVPG